MQEKVKHTLPLSPRKLEEQRLRKETNEIFAPAEPGFFADKRKRLVEKHVQEGLEKFDAKQNQVDELIFVMEL